MPLMPHPTSPVGGLARRWALAIALSPLAAAPQAHAQAPIDRPRAVLAVGTVDGINDGGVTIYRGIPYAPAPVGEMRWKPPGPAPQWTGSRAAASPAPACLQAIEPRQDTGPMSEDCLYLNAFVPADRAPAPRPVMVWFHGGTLASGSANLPLYDGRALARRGVVVVTVNHRLGPLGYFAHPALERERARGPVNFGLLDQLAALKWVRQNVAGLGGDPAQVTIFGQSGGAQSVLALMASPLARGLFQGAIVQSPYGVASHRREKALEVGVTQARAVGLPGARATMAELRRVPAEQWAALRGPALSLAPSLTFGDEAMPRPLLAAFRQGVQAPVPLIIGSTSDESGLAAAFGLQASALTDQLARAQVTVPDPPDGSGPALGPNEALVRDGVFTAYARQLARWHSARAPTWRYYFDPTDRGERQLDAAAGAALSARELVAQAMSAPPAAGRSVHHTSANAASDRGRQGAPVGTALGTAVEASQSTGARPASRPGWRTELPYVWGTTAACGCLPGRPTANDRDLESRLGDRWAHFAAHGRPGPDASWPQDDARRPAVLALGATDTVHTRFMGERLDALARGLNLDARPRAQPRAPSHTPTKAR